MKTIGLIGGMSWESSATYYRIINERVKEKLGGFHSAKSLMYSVDFAQVEKLQREGNWGQAADMMIDAARRLEYGGADFAVLCTNTMHKLFDEVQKNVAMPLLHIADATAVRIKRQGLDRVGLLGTKFTMEEDFYKGRLSEKYGLDVVVPGYADRQIIHDVIYKELCLGIMNQSSKDEFVRIANSLADQGLEGLILGCTEIPLLIEQKDVGLLLFDTTRIHAESAVDFALSDTSGL